MAIGEALGLDLSDGSALLAALRENDKIRVLPDDRLEFKVRSDHPPRPSCGCVPTSQQTASNPPLTPLVHQSQCARVLQAGQQHFAL